MCLGGSLRTVEGTVSPSGGIGNCQPSPALLSLPMPDSGDAYYSDEENASDPRCSPPQRAGRESDLPLEWHPDLVGVSAPAVRGSGSGLDAARRRSDLDGLGVVRYLACGPRCCGLGLRASTNAVSSLAVDWARTWRLCRRPLRTSETPSSTSPERATMTPACSGSWATPTTSPASRRVWPVCSGMSQRNASAKGKSQTNSRSRHPVISCSTERLVAGRRERAAYPPTDRASVAPATSTATSRKAEPPRRERGAELGSFDLIGFVSIASSSRVTNCLPRALASCVGQLSM